jgi:hypothetical protein
MIESAALRAGTAPCFINKLTLVAGKPQAAIS